MEHAVMLALALGALDKNSSTRPLTSKTRPGVVWMFELKPLAGITPAGADSAVGLAPILYCGSEGKPGLGTVSSKEDDAQGLEQLFW